MTKIHCEECEIDFKRQYNLNQHITNVHIGEKDANCSICKKSFYNEKLRNAHFKIKHPNDKMECICEKCDKKFTTRGNMLQHVRRVHLKEKRLKCDKCDHECFSKGELQNHKKTHEKKFKCILQNCDKIFDSEEEFNTHKINDHKIIRLSCLVDSCNFECISKEELKKHMESHNNSDSNEEENMVNNYENEIWRAVNIDPYYKIYQISNCGRIRNEKRKILKQSTCEDGYKFVSLTYKKKSKKYAVHRLVVLSFLNNYYDKEQVNHKNKIKGDNRLINLEWVTRSENIKHAQKGKQINNSEVMQYDGDKLIHIHISIKQAAIDLFGDKKYAANISDCLRGKRKQYGGFIWKYKNPRQKTKVNTDFKEIPKFPDYLINKNGDVYSKKRKIILGQSGSKGYRHVNIRNKSFIGKKYVHVLVASTFIDTPENVENLIINHKDSNRSNNNVENLEYVTRSQNSLESYHSENGNNKINLRKCAQYDLQGNLIKIYESQTIAARETNSKTKGISAACIGKITFHNGYIWKFV